jgi:hypothetical protein
MTFESELMSKDSACWLVQGHSHGLCWPAFGFTIAAPNQRLQPTPQAASEIVAILKPDFGSIAIPIY